MKQVEFRGSSLDDLRAFSEEAKRESGYQIDQVQHGLEPDNFKPMTSVGKSVHEICAQDQSGVFRVIYIAKFAQCVYVLHCFQKKTQKTAQKDLDLAKSRLSKLRKELDDEEE